MGGKTGHNGFPVFIRFGDITFDITGGKADHPAQHGHGGGKVGTVPFFGVEKEACDEVHVFRLVIHIQGIPEAAAQESLQGQGLVIGSASGGGRFPGQLVDRLLQVGRQLRIGFRDAVIGAVFQGGADFDQRSEPRIPGHEDRRGNSIGIPGLEISRDKDL